MLCSPYAGKYQNKANSAQLELNLGLSLALSDLKQNVGMNFSLILLPNSPLLLVLKLYIEPYIVLQSIVLFELSYNVLTQT